MTIRTANIVIVVMKEKNVHKVEALILPERDVPYEYTFEKELPLTGVGKVDFVKVQENVKKKIKKR